MSSTPISYTPLLQLLNEISKAHDAEATVAALAVLYVAIDTMALLACPVGQQEQTRTDFKAWVDKYLKADPASEYQYEGSDMYAARCALLHNYGSSSSLHRKANPPREFGYVDNGPHRKNDTERFVLISVAVLIHDFSKAVLRFLEEVQADPELRQRVDSRLQSLLLTRPISHVKP